MNSLVTFLWTVDEFYVRARNILFEAGNEPEQGLIAVDWVVKNRVADPRWPDTAKGVILQKNQFSWTMAGNWWSPGFSRAKTPWNYDPKGWARVKEIVRKVDAGAPDPTNGANHYLNVEVTRKHWGLPGWFNPSKITVKIGHHTFLKL